MMSGFIATPNPHRSSIASLQSRSTGKELVELFKALENRVTQLEHQLAENIILSTDKEELKSLIKEILTESVTNKDDKI